MLARLPFLLHIPSRILTYSPGFVDISTSNTTLGVVVLSLSICLVFKMIKRAYRIFCLKQHQLDTLSIASMALRISQLDCRNGVLFTVRS